MQRKRKIHFYLRQIDQEKAFDKIDRPFLFETMQKLGFSKNYIEFIEILYNDNNGQQRLCCHATTDCFLWLLWC